MDGARKTYPPTTILKPALRALLLGLLVAIPAAQALPPAAANKPPGLPAVPAGFPAVPAGFPAVPAGLPPGLHLTSVAALDLYRVLAGIREDLRELLSGHAEATLDQIDARLKAARTRLSNGSIPARDSALLQPEADRLAEILAQARGLSRDGLAGLGSQGLRLAPLADAGIPAWDAARDLGLSAGDSSSQVFDNNRFSANSPVSGGPAGSRDLPAAKTRLRVAEPQRKAKDIELRVPPPTTAAGQRKDAGNKDAQAKADAGADRDQVRAEFVTKRIARICSGAGKACTLEVGVADLLAAKDAAARTALSREIASEVLRVRGRPDPALAAALADFLRDIADYRPADAAAVHLSVDDANRYRLIFERAGGSRRIMLGQFLPSSGPEGRPGPGAFVLMRPIETDASGNAVQDRPGYWREYLGNDVRQEWSSTSEKEKKGWGPWSRENDLQKVWLARQSWSGGAWRETRREPAKTITAKEGKSWFGRTGDKVMKVPVLGDTIKLCDNVAATLYTGLVAAPQTIIAAVSGSDTYSLEAAGSYAKNPLMKKLVDDQGYIDRLTPGARRELYAKVRENRLLSLEALPFPVAPELKRQAVDAPVSAKEAVATLANDYGAGTYGKRLIAEGQDEKGWKKGALTAAGVATGIFENVAEGAMNPIMWAMLGAGEVAAGIKGTAAFANGAAGAQAAFSTMSAARAALTVAWWTPWLLNATDNIGKIVGLTAEGRYDKDYYKSLGELGADTIYLFIIP